MNKPISKEDFERIQAGVELEDGVVPVDDLAILSKDRLEVGIELHVGWNLVIRRLFEKVGYDVIYLDRVVYAGLTKKDLPRGKWRYLTDREIQNLKSRS